ncbi:hypothetical protein HYX58_00130 [Candidatus Dependentiae bacterium]|nr:hypothetical protein [Candidatus Dependentiae bacterium]
MNYKKLAFLVLSIFLMGRLQAVELTISQPGLYLLSDFIVSNPSGADSIINITSSNVTFDLGGYVISQGNSTAGVDGIVINSGLTDIVVQNGTIRNLTSRGIVVNQNCARININAINLQSCGTNGIAMLGAAGNTINDCQISNCRIFSCPATIAVGNTALTLTSCTRLTVNDCTIYGLAISSGLNPIIFVSMSSCTQCLIANVLIQGNSYTPSLTIIFTMFAESGGTGNIFKNCVARFNTFTGANFVGFSLLSGTTRDSFEQCQLIGNRTTGTGSFTGFTLAGITRTIFNQPVIMGNVSVGATCFTLSAGATLNTLNDAIIASNNASGAFIGISLNNASSNTFRRCISSNNRSTGNTCSGLSFVTAASNTCLVTDCLLSNNKGINDANSFGANIVTGANNLFSRNIGFNNNAAANNSAQFGGAVGFPGGSVTMPTVISTQNINGVTLYWTNLSVAT